MEIINEATYSNKKEETPIYCIKSSSSKSFLTNKTDILNEPNNYYANVGKNIFDDI